MENNEVNRQQQRFAKHLLNQKANVLQKKADIAEGQKNEQQKHRTF